MLFRSTPDELANPDDLEINCLLNGQVMQSARTSQMIVDVPSAVEFFSSFTRLAPGDVIATGTPGGVGFARQPPVWLHPGDVIEVTVENVGTIRNRVVAEPDDHAGWRWRPTGPQPRGLLGAIIRQPAVRYLTHRNGRVRPRTRDLGRPPVRSANMRDELTECPFGAGGDRQALVVRSQDVCQPRRACLDRKSTRLNSSHEIPSRMPSSA